MNYECNHESGFTLVEVLIAIVILLIMVISFTTLFSSSYKSIASSGHRSEALFGLQEDVEWDIKDPDAELSGIKTLIFPDGTAITGQHRTFKQDTVDQKEVVIDVFVFTNP